MNEPMIPGNEAERLEAVRALQILDTPAEEAFDRITRMAARIMDVPIACVTVVDKDRQWFKSQTGLGVSETERRVSFCGHAINSKSIFVVTNAHDDPRFEDNPLVVNAPNIAFYIGVPVMSPDGYPVGTLCAINTEPQTPTEAQQSLMMDLAHLVESELRLRQESSTDPLSGLMNRRSFGRIADREIARAIRNKYPVALMMVDIDHFKRINDKLGHQFGDEVIKCLGELLPGFMNRIGDTVARIGGDEFVALLVDTDDVGAKMLGKKIQDAIKAQLGQLLGKDCNLVDALTASIGVVVYEPSRSEKSLDEMLSQVDQSLYESKRNGRDQVTVSIMS